MPFKSVKQQRWAHTDAGEQALGGPAKVAEWDQASKGLSLPTYASGSSAVQKSKTFSGNNKKNPYGRP